MTSSDSRRVDGPAVLVPVKAFADAKVRLQTALDAGERQSLARSLAEGVVAAAAPLPVWIACDDDEVVAWARGLGAAIAWTPGVGLNGAVQRGLSLLQRCGAAEVLVAHADLPLPADLVTLCGFEGVTLVPDRRDDGTNVVCIPGDLEFTFAYGAGSFARHLATAEASGRAVRIVRSDDLSWDIDMPDDLADFAARL